MLPLTLDQFRTLHRWFADEGPGDMAGQHVMNTGRGRGFADRWPDPRAAMATYGDGYTLRGDPEVMSPADLAGHAGFFEAPEAFEPLLRKADPGLIRWERVYFVLHPGEARSDPDHQVRRLLAADTEAIVGLSPDLGWIGESWGGPAGLAASGYAWGAFAEGRLVSVACTYEIGNRYEDIGVITEPGFRGRGLAAACAGRLCADILGRGRVPSWSTGRENRASIRVAEKLGFTFARSGILYAVNKPLPAPARPEVAG